MIKISCLGPAGSYSELAAKTLRPDCETVFCRNFYEVIETLVKGKSDYAVLPLENSIQGGVVVNFDLILENEVFAVEETVLKIDHRLAMKEGVHLSDIRRVFSHEQALGQCSMFLSEKMPTAKLRYSDSTAESISKLDADTAGIVGAHIKAEGVVLSEENIANEKMNCTRFLLLERRKELPLKSNKVMFVATTEHIPGALVSLLQVIARHGINLTRISSRPIRGEFGKYRFFIEISGDIASPVLHNALAEVESMCAQFRLLGAYD